MERTVPHAATEEVDLYMRTVYSLLRSTAEVQIRSFEEVHSGMKSLLHPDARKASPDIPAFTYAILRLPEIIHSVKSVVLGQTFDLFMKSGYPGFESWKEVSAKARRRRCFYDGEETLACCIASRSDIDDIVPSLTAYQIEWNKLNFLLQRISGDLIHQAAGDDAQACSELAAQLEISTEDLERFKALWGSRFEEMVGRICQRRIRFGIRLLGGSLSDYWRATTAWWNHIERVCPLLLQRPIYFISSNTHSIANLLSGFALEHEAEITAYLERSSSGTLLDEWNAIREGNVRASRENFLYYVLKRYQESDPGGQIFDSQRQHEAECGITRIRSEHYFDIDAQVFELSKLNPALFDPRISNEETACLQSSDALILNIDYPLGYAAYHILAKIAEYTNRILGVYIMGKAATLNARLGDVMIPGVVHDEHSQNTYLFQNVFTASDVSPYLVYGTVLDNQKAVSVLGTFLQNAQYMDVFYREGFSDIEMESGPFLSSIYEMHRPKRHPIDEIVNLYGVPFDVGILHYASDTPLSKGRNLGAGTLSYFGMDSTYATSIAILNRILMLECRRQSNS